jgi:hypothetical protein
MTKMKNIFIGIIITFVVLEIGIGAFYLGKSTLNNKQSPPTPTISQDNTQTQAQQQLTPTPIQAQVKTITAGGVLSFPSYTLTLPDGWASQREQGQDSDKLTLTKLGYKITISEGAFGGSGCLYPGDAPQEMAQNFTSYVEISNPNGFIFRRSSTGLSGWTVCQKGSEGSFGAPTIFGHISITAPVTPDATIVAEIDSILTSLNKK